MRSVAEMTPRASSRLNAWLHFMTQSYAGSGKPNEEQLALLGELNAMKNRLRIPLLQWKEAAAAGTGAASENDG